MNIKSLPVGRLKPAPYNPRIDLKPGMPEYERLERSLDEFELVQPIVWNECTGHVVSGHQRLEILKSRGASEVPCVVVSLSEEREKALNITLNNVRVGGEWDGEKLVDVMAELDALPDFDATLTGFDPEDLRDLVMTPDPDWNADDEEEKPEEDVVRVTFEVPADDWEALRPRFDKAIAEWRVPVHIKLP